MPGGFGDSYGDEVSPGQESGGSGHRAGDPGDGLGGVYDKHRAANWGSDRGCRRLRGKVFPWVRYSM